MYVLEERNVSALLKEDVSYWIMSTNLLHRFIVVDLINGILDTTIHGLIVFECEGVTKSFDENGDEHGTFTTHFSSLESM